MRSFALTGYGGRLKLRRGDQSAHHARGFGTVLEDVDRLPANSAKLRGLTRTSEPLIACQEMHIRVGQIDKLLHVEEIILMAVGVIAPFPRGIDDMLILVCPERVEPIDHQIGIDPLLWHFCSVGNSIGEDPAVFIIRYGAVLPH